MSGSNDSTELRESVAAHFLPILLSSLAFTCLIALLRNRLSNLSLYAAASLLFFAVYFTAGCLLKGRPFTQAQSGNCAGLLTLFLTGGCLLVTFFRESRKDQGSDFNESLFRYQIPHWAYFLLLAAATAAGFFLIQACRQQKRHPLFRLLISLPYAAFLSCTVWVPNIFYNLHTVYHAHAYYSTICDVLNLAPFGTLNPPFYGHYGLFFLLPCRILGIFGIPQNIAIATTLAFCNLTALLAVLYAVHVFVRNDGVFLLTLLALGNPYLMMMPKLHYVKDVYLQLIPHRILFPAITCAFMAAFSAGALNRRRIFVLYLLAALSFLWNTESGLVCIAAISLYVFLRRLDRSVLLSAGNLKTLGSCAVPALAAMLAAYLTVTCYSFLTGGQGLSFRTYMYPILGDFTGIVPRGPLPDLLRTWVPVTIFFLAATAVCAMRIMNGRGSRGNSSCFLSMAVMALGLLVYYLDNGIQVRLMISFFQFVILLAVLLDFLIARERAFTADRGLSLIALTVMTTFVLGNAGMKEVLTDRRATAWQVKSLSRFAGELDREIPEGTLAFGRGVSDLFAAMNRDPGIHVLDWVDITLDSNPIFLAHVNGILEGADRFFAYEESAALLPASSSFVIEKEYAYKGWKYALYTRK